MNKAEMINEILDRMEKLSHDGKEEFLAFLQIMNGEMPDNHLAALRVNRTLIKAQRQGEQIPAGTMPVVASVALKIIDGVADLSDRRILMSYYWHCEDDQGNRVAEVLMRNGFTPA